MAKAKTGALPGMERKGIREIELAAEEYVEHRDKRMAVLEKEIEAKAKLMAAMKKSGQTSYQFEEDNELFTVDLVSSDETVKVKRTKADGDDDD